MAISKNRLKFLDNENKILVKKLDDLTTNNILSNINTPDIEGLMLVDALDALNKLKGLEGAIRGILTDISNINIKDVLNGILSNGGVTLDSVTMGVIGSFMVLGTNVLNGLLQSSILTSLDKVIDSAGVLDKYSSMASDLQGQISAMALDNFVKKITSGVTGVNDVINDLKRNVEGITTTEINNIKNILGKITKIEAAINAALELPPMSGLAVEEVSAALTSDSTTDDGYFVRKLWKHGYENWNPELNKLPEMDFGNGQINNLRPDGDGSDTNPGGGADTGGTGEGGGGNTLPDAPITLQYFLGYGIYHSLLCRLLAPWCGIMAVRNDEPKYPNNSFGHNSLFKSDYADIRGASLPNVLPYLTHYNVMVEILREQLLTDKPLMNGGVSSFDFFRKWMKNIPTPEGDPPRYEFICYAPLPILVKGELNDFATHFKNYYTLGDSVTSIDTIPDIETKLVTDVKALVPDDLYDVYKTRVVRKFYATYMYANYIDGCKNKDKDLVKEMLKKHIFGVDSLLVKELKIEANYLELTPDIRELITTCAKYFGNSDIVKLTFGCPFSVHGGITKANNNDGYKVDELVMGLMDNPDALKSLSDFEVYDLLRFSLIPDTEIGVTINHTAFTPNKFEPYIYGMPEIYSDLFGFKDRKDMLYITFSSFINSVIASITPGGKHDLTKNVIDTLKTEFKIDTTTGVLKTIYADKFTFYNMNVRVSGVSSALTFDNFLADTF